MTEVIGIDHIYLTVSSMERSEQFYDIVMTALGYRKRHFQIHGEGHIHYFNRQFGFVLRPAHDAGGHNPYAPGLHHFCLRVESSDEIKEIAAILREQKLTVTEPQLYPQYAPDYYAIFFSDPDGIKLEITNYREERKKRHDHWESTDV